MIVGMNHSGKTTFARQLEQKVNNLVVVENDVRREFAEKNYRKLRDISREWVRTFDRPDLRTYHLKTMIEYAILEWLNICLANCNTKKQYRKAIIEFARNNNAKVIMIHMNIEYRILLERAKKAHLTKNQDIYSWKIWIWETIKSDNPIIANLERMRENFDTPTVDEADTLLQVDNTNWDEMMHKVVELVWAA